MSLALYMDEHVPRAITEALRSRGLDVLTSQEDGMTGRADPELLDRAAALGRVVYSQDADFLREAHRRQTAGVPFAGVAYSHQNWLSIGQRIRDLETIASTLDPSKVDDRVIYLPYSSRPES